MADTIQTFMHSTIQHGPENNRIYLMDLCMDDLPDMVEALIELAQSRRYSKIITKVPVSAKPDFDKAGFVCEAVVPNFYRGKESAVFLARYFCRERARPITMLDRPLILERAIRRSQTPQDTCHALPVPCEIRKATPSDTQPMAQLYRDVFGTYPFPIDDPDYLKQTMGSHVEYFCATHREKIVAQASCEMDVLKSNVELTDFATHPDWRGHGLAYTLLMEMQKRMIAKRLFTGYTIARALSMGMNMTFAKAGYTFGGTLNNNTQISGQIESMNVWYRDLSP